MHKSSNLACPSRHSNLWRFTLLLVGRLLRFLLASRDSAPYAIESIDDGGEKDDRAVPTIADEFVRDVANDDSGGERECGDNNTDRPLGSIDGDNGESARPKEDDEDLTSDHDGVDAEEEVVLEHALEDIEFVVKTTVAIWLLVWSFIRIDREDKNILELVEDLHPDESVEYHCPQLSSFFLARIT